MRMSILALVVASGALLLADPPSEPTDSPPPDGLYRAYLNLMDKAERQYHETVAPAQKLRDQKIAEAQAAYTTVADHALQIFAAARKKAAADTIAAYDSQIKDVTRSGDLDKALAVRSAKDRFIALAGTSTTPVDDDSVENSAVPETGRGASVSPCWNVGITGSSNSGNVYGLVVLQKHEHVDLLFRVALTSPNSNSNGDVYLVDPAGKQIKVWSWTPSMRLPVLSTDFKDVERTRLVKIDISKWVNGRGIYQLKFAFKEGESALSIWGVEMSVR